MAGRRITWLDVFTDRPLTGNPLAVVHDADGLADEVMHSFARETRLSETTFVQSPTAEGADYRNRIWMPMREIAFAGHPSLGTAVAVARAGGQDRASYVQETHAGLQPVEVEIEGARARASMLQEPAQLGEELDEEPTLRVVGLEPADVDPRLPPRVVSTGVNQVLICVRDRAAVARAWPDYDAIAGLLSRFGGVVVYVAAVDVEAGTAHARSFADSRAVGEDPATGAACGPLLAYAHAFTGMETIEITQGVEMGRPSVLRGSLEGDRVRVGGDVVALFDGTVHLDG